MEQMTPSASLESQLLENQVWGIKTPSKEYLIYPEFLSPFKENVLRLASGSLQSNTFLQFTQGLKNKSPTIYVMTIEKYISEPHMCNFDYTLGTSGLAKSLNLNKNFLELLRACF